MPPSISDSAFSQRGKAVAAARRPFSVNAIIAAVLFLPAFLAEQTGYFSSLRAPDGIERLELVQGVVAVLAIGLGFWMLRRVDRSRDS